MLGEVVMSDRHVPGMRRSLGGEQTLASGIPELSLRELTDNTPCTVEMQKCRHL